MLVAPLNLRERFEELILREIEVQRSGGQGHLVFKMNALEDGPMIKLLYRASQAGVKIDLIVRGACCLRPQIPGISDNIQRDQHPRPLSGAQPDLLFPKQRLAAMLSGQRRSDAAQLKSPR